MATNNVTFRRKDNNNTNKDNKTGGSGGTGGKSNKDNKNKDKTGGGRRERGNNNNRRGGENRERVGGGGQGEREERPPPEPPHLQAGIVKAVVSGDTVTILEFDDTHPNNKQYKEILFTFLGLKAPQLARRMHDGNKDDEPFAWQSREFLRKLLIGKPVVYRVEHETGPASAGRNYGELWSHDDKDIRLAIVRAGWADVIVKPRKDSNGNDLDLLPAQQQLKDSVEEATSKKLGIWSSNTKDAVRKIKVHDLYKDRMDTLHSDELYDFYKAVKDKCPLHGIVESVKSGSSITVYLPESNDQFPLMLAGVRSPGNKTNEIEAYSREAKFFTEYYLLHREVKIYLEGMDKINLFGTVLVGETNIGRSLLENGLASFVDWSAPKDSSIVESYKIAEKSAQEQRKRIFLNHSPVSKPVKSAGGGKDAKITKETSIVGKVVEIVNASTITVRVSKADSNNGQKTVDRIITLSSIRALRTTAAVAAAKADDEKSGTATTLTPEQEEEIKRETACANEAKEFLRSALIGQKVRCVFDYFRPIGPNNNNNRNENSAPPQMRLYWTVYYQEVGVEKKNVAVELVKNGYGRVVSHPEEEPRATAYQDLIVAEKAAEAARKGIHAAVYRATLLNDLTPVPLPRGGEGGRGGKGGSKESNKEAEEKAKIKSKVHIAKCRQFFTFLQRHPKVDAIVDYVFAASRFKLTIPAHNCVVMLTLQGCLVERPEKSKEKISAKPDISIFDKQYPPNCPGNLALHFARDHVFQRKVQVSITNVDNFGNFLGQLFVNNKDFILLLIEHGHARLHYRMAKKLELANFDLYKEAEEKAREQLKGLWATFDFEKEKNRNTATERPIISQEKQSFPIIVTDVRSGNSFSYQIQNEETNSLNELSASLQKEKFHQHPSHHPGRGEIVAAQFSVDDLWYRAQVISNNQSKGSKEPPTEYEVKYIDYGNREWVATDRIRKLDQEYIELIKPQSHDGKLMMVKSPSIDSEFGKDSQEGLRELVWGKSLTAVEEYKEKISTKETKEAKEPQFLHHLFLTDEEKTDINLELISRGHARVAQRSRDEDEEDSSIASYVQAEEEARNERLGIWQYGYYPDSDEERQEERSLMK